MILTYLNGQLSLRKNKDALHVTNEEAKYFRLVFALKLYLKLQFSQWQLILLSRKPERGMLSH
ncbi:hypothetical protein ACS0TY_013178 [Phlomoides rotata]